MNTKTQDRVIKVLERMQAQVVEDEIAADMYSEMLEDGLTTLNNSDAFGTEGQNDPRGDFRNGEWTMDCVEGIDEPEEVEEEEEEDED